MHEFSLLLLEKIGPEELQRAKNMTKILVTQNLEKKEDRIEDFVKSTSL
jgi:hypothetical protein